MRVIGGTARGRRLSAPPVSVRPTADRVREAIFDVLEHLDVLYEAQVLDLFAGSGALGIEALSRGAAFATFVESDRLVRATIETNLTTLGFGPELSRVVPREAFAYLAGTPAPVDVAFCDPPYDFSDWPQLLSLVSARWCVIESNREIDLGERYVLHRQYRYGGTLVAVAQLAGAPEEGLA